MTASMPRGESPVLPADAVPGNAGRCYLAAPGTRTGRVSTVARSPSTGQELPRNGEIVAHWVSIFQGAEACPEQLASPTLSTRHR